MKRKMFTRSHDIDLLREIDNNGAQFSGEEHSIVIEKQYSDKFETKESLLRWYLSTDAVKLSSLGFLIDIIVEEEFTNILSLCAGTCVLEYLLKYALPENANVVATDFDSYFIKKAETFFPSISPVKFDFFKDDVGELQEKLGYTIDIAVFFGSSYVMDDTQFVQLFKRLKEISVKQIIDFHAGYIDLKNFLINLLPFLKRSSIIRKLFGYPPRCKDEYIGKFHGYARSRGELRKLYKESGIILMKEVSVSSYKYVAISNCSRT